MVIKKSNALAFNFSLGKKGQFFILSAVIIASIIVSLATVQNYVVSGGPPTKFYYYSSQLEKESGAVVDFVLVDRPGEDKLGDFMSKGIAKTKAAYPEMEVYACYSGRIENQIYCQNNGTREIQVWSSCDLSGKTILSPAGTMRTVCNGIPPSCSDVPADTSSSLTVNCDDVKLSFNVSNVIYTIPLTNTSIAGSQFYFQFLLNSSSGTAVIDSTNAQKKKSENDKVK